MSISFALDSFSAIVLSTGVDHNTEPFKATTAVVEELSTGNLYSGYGSTEGIANLL
jgi:hypothetical protein